MGSLSQWDFPVKCSKGEKKVDKKSLSSQHDVEGKLGEVFSFCKTFVEHQSIFLNWSVRLFKNVKNKK